MTNTRIKDTLYEDAHLDERGMQDRGGGGEAKAVWQPLLRTWHISLFLFFCLCSQQARGGWQLQRISASGLAS